MMAGFFAHPIPGVRPFRGQRRKAALSKFAPGEFVFLTGDPVDQISLSQASGFTTVAWIPFGPFWLSNPTRCPSARFL